MTVKNYVLDINKTSLQHPSIVLRQDDYNIYTINISVTENGTPVDLGSYTLNFLGITPAGAKIIDSKNFITNAGDLKNGKFSYKFPKEAAGSKGVYDVAYFRLKTTLGATSTIDLNLRVLGGIDLTADEVKDYITVDDTLRNTLVSEVFKKVDAKVDEHLATVVKGDKGDKGDPGKDGYMPIIGGRNLLLDTGRSFTGIGTNTAQDTFNAQGGQYYLAGGKNVSDLYNQYGSSGYLTISFDWVASGDTISGQFNSEWSGVPWGGLANSGAIKPSTTNTSGHYESTVPLNAGGYSTGTATAIRFRQDNLQGNITISNLKLEAGNVATDWSPAPEDITIKIGGRNLIVRTGELSGQMINEDGKVAPFADSAVTPAIITVTAGEPLTMSSTTEGFAFRYAFYDETGNTIVRKYVGLRPATTVIVPEKAVTFRISYPITSKVKLERGNVATDWTPAPEDLDSKYVQKYGDTMTGTLTAPQLTATDSINGFLKAIQVPNTTTKIIDLINNDFIKGKDFWKEATFIAYNRAFSDAPTNDGYSIIKLATRGLNRTYVEYSDLSGNIWHTTATGSTLNTWVKQAEDSTVVHNTGNETVAGNKTLTGLTTMLIGNYGLRVTSSGFQKTTDGGKTWVIAQI